MKKSIFIIFLILILISAFFGYRFYAENYGNNVSKKGYFHIPSNATYNQVIDSISPYLSNKQSFLNVAEAKNLSEKYKPGRYKIEDQMSNSSIVNMIKAGNQIENSFRIGDFGDVYQMIGRVSKKTEIDSATFISELNKIAQKKGFENAEDLKKFFFIDTYYFYWTVSPADFFKRFEDQYNTFWNETRLEKERKSGLTRQQIYALASIVYKESGGKKDEQKIIAGLYLNRVKKGMKLQSDPTVIYAIKKESNFQQEIKRVFYKHLKYPSPYNTYANFGIPPGPICIVDKNAVDAVLDPENHNYIFMAADPKKLGYHKFTSSDIEHAKNAKEYQEWLNSKNIK